MVRSRGNSVGRVACTLAALVACSAGSASAATLFAIDTFASQRLLSFDSADPATLLSARAITGLQANETLVGIDFRPSTGQLYAIGSTSRIYTLNPNTGAATLQALMSVQLNGTEFDIDFNPVTDELRVVGDLDQNLRVNVATGAVTVDTSVAYGAGDPNAGKNPNIVGAAYDNSYVGATFTTLYTIDSVQNTLVIQSPANAGTLATVGSLGVNPTSVLGFDVHFDGQYEFGYAAMQIAGETESKLFTLNGVSGAATAIGIIGSSEDNLIIRDIAAQPIPEPAAMALAGIGAGTLLLRRRARASA